MTIKLKPIHRKQDPEKPAFANELLEADLQTLFDRMNLLSGMIEGMGHRMDTLSREVSAAARGEVLYK